MKLLVVAALALAGLGALVGRSTAAGAQPIPIHLPKHVFGQTKRPDGGRVADARWGKGRGQVGFVKAEYGPTGGSSFDAILGVVCILDQHNGRVLVFAPGKPVRAIPLVVKGAAGGVFRGVESSLAVGTDGTIYVLEPVDAIHHKPTLRSFPARGGAPLATVTTAGSSPIVRAGGKTAYVSKLVEGPWQTTMKAGRPANGKATPYRSFPGGNRVQVEPNVKQPIDVTLFRSNGTSPSWAVSSPDHIGVEDAEPLGNDLVLVLAVSTSRANEYEVLLLGRKGLVHRYSVPDDHYAETALFDDFRLDGGTLYHRGSTKRGVYVDSYRP